MAPLPSAPVSGVDAGQPVLVGAGQVVHRPEDGQVPTEVELMTAAARVAGEDAGCPDLLARVGWVGAAKGTWTLPDPGRDVAAVLGADRVHTVLGEVGVLQQAVVDAGLAAVRDGAPAALVLGAEANHGSSAGAVGAVGEARRAAAEPDEHLTSQEFGVSAVEVNHRFLDPPTVYAVLEDAWGRAQGWTAEEHRRRLGELWAGFARVAATNPVAWDQSAPDAATIVEPGPDNRLVAEPYTKRCCSNLRVNQAVALLLTTVEGARSAGVPEDRWVFPQGSAVANHAVAVVQRDDLARSPIARGAGQRALALAGADDLDHVDLYSCFPAAVQIAAAELGLDGHHRLTVTGGMTFGGGPLNSYALHSTATMAGVLRADPGSRGLVTSVSAFLTKYGAAVWSTTPHEDGWRSDDVTAEVAAIDPPRPDADALEGPVEVVAATVAHARDGSRRRFEVVEDRRGTRSLRARDL
jgi:acetyl-CoA C-acetyltransferase